MKNEIWRFGIWLIGRHQERKALRRPDPNLTTAKWCFRVVVLCIIFSVVMSHIS